MSKEDKDQVGHYNNITSETYRAMRAIYAEEKKHIARAKLASNNEHMGRAMCARKIRAKWAIIITLHHKHIEPCGPSIQKILKQEILPILT